MSVAFAAPRLSVARSVASVRPSVAAKAKAGNWLPGAASPTYLDGSLPGDYGFDPLSLGEFGIDRLREAELMNGRWAMMACAGCLGVELLGIGTWFDAPLWAVSGGSPTYFGVDVPIDIKTVALLELVLMAGVEIRRNEESDPTKRQYPGGAFDPMGFTKDATKFETLKLKEVKNGRLAMLSFIGYIGQHNATGKGPLAALSEHLASPGGANFATNGTSLPQSAFPFLY